MAKAAYKHPAVFVGCPYTPVSFYKSLKLALDKVPLTFFYADSTLRTKHVLERIRRAIVRCDYSMFDVTDWNPNVALELGLADGLNKDYYVLFKPGKGKKSRPMADVEGLQRIQYTKLEGDADTSLEFQVDFHLVRRLAHPRYIYDHLSGKDRHKQFLLAMRLLGHFKNHKVLRHSEVLAYRTGTYLRDDAIGDVIELLKKRGLMKGKGEQGPWTAGKGIFKRVVVD